METLPLLPLRGVLACGIVAVVLLAGCVSLDEHVHKTAKPPAPGIPCQVVCTWQNSVVFAPDPVRGGQPTPGIAGRIYLFGQQLDYPLLGNGGLVIDLYDESKSAPVMLERWEIDPETLQRLVKQDMIGWGYTVFLPWSHYAPDITKIRLRTAFKSGKGAPIYAESGVTLSPGNGVIREGTTPLASPVMQGKR